MTQQPHCRVEFHLGIDRNKYFCMRVHSNVTQHSHKVAAAQCPGREGWMGK